MLVEQSSWINILNAWDILIYFIELYRLLHIINIYIYIVSIAFEDLKLCFSFSHDYFH